MLYRGVYKTCTRVWGLVSLRVGLGYSDLSFMFWGCSIQKVIPKRNYLGAYG